MPERLFGCIRCPVDVAMKPHDAFEQKGENGRRRMDSVCRDCRRAEAEERERRAQKRQSTKTIDGVLMRRCSGAHHDGDRWLPLDGEHFAPSIRNPDGSVKRYDYRCKACRSAYVTAYDKRMRRDPIKGPEYRAKRNAVQDSFRHRNPELARAYGQAWKRRLKADPVRYAAYLADQRINYRLRRERAGQPVKARGSGSAVGAHRAPNGRCADRDGRPVEPLALWYEALRAQDHRDADEIAAVMQVNERILNRIERREYPRVTLAVADALVWGYGRPVHIPAERVERLREQIEEHWRSAPGNGERLIGYLTDAERIAHLAGAVVDRVEDLWLDLAQ